MARPSKNTVDYFPHFVKGGKTIYILENKYGNDGYAFWFKLLEILCDTNGQVYDCNNEANWEFLLAKTRVSSDIATDILNTLSLLYAIDKELWETQKIIWIENLVTQLSPVYSRRNASLPKKPKLLVNNNIVNDDRNSDEKDSLQQDGAETELNEVNVNKKPQRRVEESRVEKSRVKESRNTLIKDKRVKNKFSPKVDFDRIVKLYHSSCPSYPKILKLSDDRKHKITIRFLDEMKGDYTMLEDVFKKMEESKFLRGDNKRGWKATFDWLFMNAKNWVKVAEGNYDNQVGVKKTIDKINDIW